ncbi:sigma-70 family RNA polymerase sigma factor [Fimbriiglobus ruber]|uniref:RNA polymerase sigma factor RpoD n=1 Tax=Fimbriiglobus ruber TaxID=1908690 RepID=A0A225DDT6_9BACT|nr:sigma-70 family RNA polymerase sigma factor [Fimbriiglobus ruber]OWK34565.1 RNA polymerase sigma factor RpoD [Fimbriiglobus ruber]
MNTTTEPEVVTRRAPRTALLPSYVIHPSFDAKTARKTFEPSELLDHPVDFGDKHMPDDVTRDHARRMHYAAHRLHAAKTPGERARWQQTYFRLRDQIVLGNRKLIYRAVRRRMAVSNRADDMIGDCHIVLIQAVAAYNPWLGIRFSTYAYTCLVRALARMSHRLSTDWLARSMPLEALPDGEPRMKFVAVPSTTGQVRIEEFLRDDHPLLSDREKSIISRRFCLGDESNNQTLEKVGKELGLSKERVRQVQATALDKLRQALTVHSSS